MGLLALSGNRPRRFSAGMGAMFLTRLLWASPEPPFMPVSGKRMGLLALSGNRPRRFAAGMGAMFLTQLTELIENMFAPSLKERRGDG